jgi:hypothetical protein
MKRVFLSCTRDCQLGAQQVSAGYRKIALDIELLRHVAKLGSRRSANRSRVRYRANERSEQHRFARAVRTNDRKRSPTGDGETEVRKDHRVVEADSKAIHLEDRTSKGCLLAGYLSLWNLSRYQIHSAMAGVFASFPSAGVFLAPVGRG